MKTTSQSEFIQRFAKNAGTTQKTAKKYLAWMLEDTTNSLARGNEVRFHGIGALKRVRFPSKTMVNPSDRSQKVLVFDRYYARIKPSSLFKAKLKARLFPDKYQYSPKTTPMPSDGTSVNIGRSHAVPIKVRPSIPAQSWRKPMSGLVMDLRSQRPDPQLRLLRNLLRQATQPQIHATTLSPYELQTYGAQNSNEPMSQNLYHTTTQALHKQLPVAFSSPQSWRLLVHMPSDSNSGRHIFNFAAFPSGDDDWLVNFAAPRAQRRQTNTSMQLPEETTHVLDGILEKGKGKIAIIGAPDGREATFEQVKNYLGKRNIGYHHMVEHHHHSLHPHVSLNESLRDLHKQAGTYPVTVIDELSGADNLFYLRHMPGITICKVVAPNKQYFDRLMALQNIPPGFFDAVIEGIALPRACSKCMPTWQPAVRFAPMRRLAAARGELLHVHPVRVDAECNHDPEYELVNIVSGSDQKQGLNDKLYRMALDHTISQQTLADHLR